MNAENNIEVVAVSADIDERELRRRAYADEFGSMWAGTGGPMMDGRVMGYCMIMQEPFISSADLCAVLNASAGSVSMSTRRLVEVGYLKRHVVAGDRSHYFRADSDIWGSWLAGERRYLDRERQAIELGLAVLDPDDEKDIPVRERLINGRDYFAWVITYHHKMLADWEAFKAARDAKSDATSTNSTEPTKE